ncbi:hypothetical protein M408DRAFT_67143 [Serendipita vermifera MAFF 305830]|uniref:PNPLA domain-containing protein n=1 Tax=Serendipita vermifera MAFF 305830 TaxID=933852 RepID=A0A0C3BFB1_SERVB|nr:hypothetical protein M408DRAFT_67143 [Serendipita vermifera MAFF 305830]
MPLGKNLRLASFGSISLAILGTELRLTLTTTDAGGVRGFSQLEIMRNIMHSLNWERDSTGFEGSALPCQHFDLIGGSGTGGLLAIMFTRLRMSIEEASDEFFTITEEVYRQDALDSSERSKRLRQCIEDMLQRRQLPLDIKLMEETPGNDCAGYVDTISNEPNALKITHRFVVASLRNNLETRMCFRTYPIRAQPSSQITVVNAILATCATQPAFTAVSVGERYRKREYVGAGFGGNNPIQEVITEAHLLFGGESNVSSLLSIGTGHPGIIALSPGINGPGMDEAMRDMMNDCEQKAQDMEQRLGPAGIYSRFSVDQGMQNRHPDELADPGWITAQTEGYLTRHDTRDKLGIFVQNVNAERRSVTLDQLST